MDIPFIPLIYCELPFCSSKFPVVNRLIRWAVTFVMVAALCFAFYEAGQEVGRSKARVQVVEKQVEVIRYVEKKKAEIHARPNAGRDDLLKLMRAGRL